ncbi:hypothetical protein RAA17_00835 [Komagataeibacter rhaeticus]|nr:hypothetical protein [Komagataeibacter rhaeticus]
MRRRFHLGVLAGLAIMVTGPLSGAALARAPKPRPNPCVHACP